MIFYHLCLLGGVLKGRERRRKEGREEGREKGRKKGRKGRRKNGEKERRKEEEKNEKKEEKAREKLYDIIVPIYFIIKSDYMQKVLSEEIGRNLKFLKTQSINSSGCLTNLSSRMFIL